MKKNYWRWAQISNGFTLIELLAVIVILAIIALIAVPIILDIIGSTRIESKKRSIDLYGKSIELAIARKSLTEEVPKGSYTTSGNTLTLEDSDFSFEVEYDGARVDCNFIQIHDDMTISLDDCKVDGENIVYSYGDVYTELRYLRSTGGQYIDTKYIPNNNTKVEIYGNLTTSGNGSIFGVNPLFVITNGANNGSTYMFRYNNVQYISNVSKNELNLLTLDKNKAYIDNTLLHEFTPATFEAKYSALLFGRRSSSGGLEEVANQIIYYCKIYEDDKLVRDFIPVLDKEGTPCMYDKVGKVFYYNLGSGVFGYA